MVKKPSVESFPASLEAERAVLRSLLSNEMATTEILSRLKPNDFSIADHQLVFRLASELFQKQEPIDLVTMSMAYRKNGGTNVLISDLMAGESFTGNFQAHIKGVRDLSRRRHVQTLLLEAGEKIAGNGDVDETVAELLTGLNQASQEKVRHPIPLELVIAKSMKRIEKGMTKMSTISGVPTGYRDYDQKIGGFQPGDVVIIGARPSLGKALALETKLPTPEGWTEMGDVDVGDYLIDAEGMPTRVVAVSEVMTDRVCYAVRFIDGTIITADADHLWVTETRSSRRASTPPGGYIFKRHSKLSRDQRWKSKKESLVTTAMIADTLTTGMPKRSNHTIKNCRPWQLKERDLPIDPYVLGAWLGDGHSSSARITSKDEEVVRNISNAGQRIVKNTTLLEYGLPGLQKRLRSLGVFKNKHIPREYLRASELQRRALLSGLLDTDGTVTKSGHPQFCSTNISIAKGFTELLSTLGYRFGVSEKKVKGRHDHSSIAYIITFAPNDVVFKLTRKAVRQSISRQPRAHRRPITEVKNVASVPVRCVQVDSPSGLFLASRSCIPTHNSALMACIAQRAAERGYPSIIINAEMEDIDVGTRLLAGASDVENYNLRRGVVEDHEVGRVVAASGKLSHLPIWIYDNTDWNIIETEIRALKVMIPNLALGFFDYLTLMEIERLYDERRDQQIGRIMKRIKRLAKDLSITCIVGAQLSRNVAKEAKEPELIDLRECGDIEQDADVVTFLHKFKPKERPWDVYWLIKKARNAPLGFVQLKFIGADAAFYDWEKEDDDG